MPDFIVFIVIDYPPVVLGRLRKKTRKPVGICKEPAPRGPLRSLVLGMSEEYGFVTPSSGCTVLDSQNQLQKKYFLKNSKNFESYR